MRCVERGTGNGERGTGNGERGTVRSQVILSEAKDLAQARQILRRFAPQDDIRAPRSAPRSRSPFPATPQRSAPLLPPRDSIRAMMLATPEAAATSRGVWPLPET